VWNHPGTLSLLYFEEQRKLLKSKKIPTLDDVRRDLIAIVAMHEARRDRSLDNDVDMDMTEQASQELEDMLTPSPKKRFLYPSGDEDEDQGDSSSASDGMKDFVKGDSESESSGEDSDSGEDLGLGPGSALATQRSASGMKSGPILSLVDTDSDDEGDNEGHMEGKSATSSVMGTAGRGVVDVEDRGDSASAPAPAPALAPALALTPPAPAHRPDSPRSPTGGESSPEGETRTLRDMAQQYENPGWYRLGGVSEDGSQDVAPVTTPHNAHLDDWVESLGSKVVMALQLLALSVNVGDKVLLFSNSNKTLDFLELVLSDGDWGFKLGIRPSSSANGITFSNWSRGDQFFRIDGSTADRQVLIDKFNKKARPRLMLLGTKAANMGINLYSANRIIIFDISWNPSNDLQAIYRGYRYGQKKAVFVYRLVAKGTMEEKMFRMSVNKQQLSARVVDAQAPEAQFTAAEREHLFNFDADAVGEEGQGESHQMKEFLAALQGSAAPDTVLEELMKSTAGKKALKSVQDQVHHRFSRPPVTLFLCPQHPSNPPL
jgi:hypothetical protein